MTEQSPAKVEPSIYREILVREMTTENMQVPHNADGIRAVASWVESTGNGEVGDVGPDGFRFRSVYRDSDGTRTGENRWYWAEPGDWLRLMYGTGQDREFDMPDTSDWWTSQLDGNDHVSGPTLHEGAAS